MSLENNGNEENENDKEENEDEKIKNYNLLYINYKNKLNIQIYILKIKRYLYENGSF